MRAALLAVAVGCATAESGPMRRVVLSDSQVAKCLDGSPYTFYYRPAPEGSAHASEWVFDMQGGGACLTKKACTKRAGTPLGSSKGYLEELTDPAGVLSSNASFNPFWDFNHVFLPYCTGDVHIGQWNTTNKWGLHFAGHLNFEGTLAHLKRHANLDRSSKVLLTGESAGGIGTFNNADYLQLELPRAKVYAMPDAGWYFPNGTHSYVEWKAHKNVPYSIGFTTLLHTLFRPYVNPFCAVTQAFKHRCIDASVNYKHIRVPLLVLENMYDSQQIRDELLCPVTAACPKYIDAYGEWMRADMHRQVLNDPRTQNGLWMPACLDHTADLCMRHPLQLRGTTVNRVAHDWYFNGKAARIIEDCGTSPCNTQCDAYQCGDLHPAGN